MKLFKLNIVTRVPSDNILERTKLKSLSMKKLLYFTIVVLLTFSCTTQSSHGHLIGASGAIELLSCILALKKGVLAPTINFEKYDGQCNINLVTNDAQNLRVSQTISNSFAFGGLNAVLVLKKFH